MSGSKRDIPRVTGDLLYGKPDLPTTAYLSPGVARSSTTGADVGDMAAAAEQCFDIPVCFVTCQLCLVSIYLRVVCMQVLHAFINVLLPR